jgi:uncharacterized protein
MPDQFTATAVVATAAPERYAKQLASHLGRRAEVREEGADIRIVLTDGSCVLRSRPGGLELHAAADSSDALERVMDVVGRHLERFGQRNELHVDWARA